MIEPAVALLAHLSGRGLRAEERAADVDAEDAVELRRLERLEQEVREHAGVVDEHVEAPEPLGRDLDEPGRALRGRHVAHGDRDRPALAGEPPAGRFEAVAAHVGEHDRASRLGETPGAREAEALGCAGDERRLPAQVEQRGKRAIGVDVTFVRHGSGSRSRGNAYDRQVIR